MGGVRGVIKSLTANRKTSGVETWKEQCLGYTPDLFLPNPEVVWDGGLFISIVWYLQQEMKSLVNEGTERTHKRTSERNVASACQR